MYIIYMCICIYICVYVYVYVYVYVFFNFLNFNLVQPREIFIYVSILTLIVLMWRIG